jgi:hypothetical protein
LIRILDGTCTWEEFEKLFSNKWIKDTKMEECIKFKMS